MGSAEKTSPLPNKEPTAIGMGLVGGKTPSAPVEKKEVAPRGHVSSKSNLEMLKKRYSGGGDGEQGEGIKNYFMKADSYRFLSGSSKNVTTGPMRKGNGGGGGGGKGGGRGRGGAHRQPTQNVTTNDNPVPRGTQTREGAENYVMRCSNVGVFIAFAVSLSFPLSMVICTLTKSQIWDYGTYLTPPLSYGSLIVSTHLQPRNNAVAHKTLLYTQCFLILIFPEIMRTTIFDSSLSAFVVASFRLCLCLWLVRFFLSIRLKIAPLQEKKLSHVLTDRLVIPALTFLGVTIFFTLDPVKCLTQNPDDLEVFERTLAGQMGLISILLVHFVFSNLSVVFPKHVTDKHIVTLNQFASGELTLRKRLNLLVIAIRACCFFFLFTHYNTRAKLIAGEAAILIGVGGLGVILLLLMDLWEWNVMERETREIRERKRKTELGLMGRLNTRNLRRNWW